MAQAERDALLRGFARTDEPEPLKVQCPPPTRHGQDEMRCNLCSRIWATDEDRPECIGIEFANIHVRRQ